MAPFSRFFLLLCVVADSHSNFPFHFLFLFFSTTYFYEPAKHYTQHSHSTPRRKYFNILRRGYYYGYISTLYHDNLFLSMLFSKFFLYSSANSFVFLFSNTMCAQVETVRCYVFTCGCAQCTMYMFLWWLRHDAAPAQIGYSWVLSLKENRQPYRRLWL